MKKIYFLFICFFIFMINCNASVKLTKCVDGDTAWFNIDGVNTKVRFLAIDTPESTNEVEYYGKESSEFTCNSLKNAKTITLEYENNKQDKYNRTLAWIFVDDKLLQSEIIKNGYGEVKYIYDDYKYTDILYENQKYAQKNKLGMWQEKKNSNIDVIIICSLIIIVFICICIKKR